MKRLSLKQESILAVINHLPEKGGYCTFVYAIIRNTLYYERPKGKEDLKNKFLFMKSIRNIHFSAEYIETILSSELNKDMRTIRRNMREALNVLRKSGFTFKKGTHFNTQIYLTNEGKKYCADNKPVIRG